MSAALAIDVADTHRVSALLDAPANPRALYVFAHGAGAGAGMTHPFMAAVAHGLLAHDIATLRYQFPYMEQRSRRPDAPALAHATVRAAVAAASDALPGVPLFAGGKSFGGRMTSQAQALAPLRDVRGLAFVGRTSRCMERESEKDQPAHARQRPRSLRLRRHPPAERFSAGKERELRHASCGLGHGGAHGGLRKLGRVGTLRAALHVGELIAQGGDA
jgi:hypothetical protein